MTSTKAKIRALNDELRQCLIRGHVEPPNRTLMTPGVDALTPAQKLTVCREVAEFDDFDNDNDPNREHDFGHVTLDGTKIFWKIDYYATDMADGAEDPSDPAKTARVLTLMRADEY